MCETAIKENTKVEDVLDKINNFKKVCKKAKYLLRFLIFSIIVCIAGTIYSAIQVVIAEPKTLEYVKAIGDLKYQLLLTIVCIFNYYWSKNNIEDDLTKQLNAIEKEFEEATKEMTI